MINSSSDRGDKQAGAKIASAEAGCRSPKRTVRPHGVVVLPSACDHDLGLPEGVEDLPGNPA